MAQRNFYSFEDGMKILKLMARMTKLQTKEVTYQVCEGSTCVNGMNSADGSFLLTPNYNTLEENLNDVYEWMKNEVTKPARRK